MDLTSLFSLRRGGGRADDTTQGGRADGNTAGATGGRVDGGQRRTSLGSNEWDDADVRLPGDDPSAPDVAARFGRGGNRPRPRTMSSHWGGGVATT